MQVSSRRGLRQDAAEGKVGRIGLHCERQIRLVVPENGSRGESVLQGPESCSSRFRPGELHRLSGESSQWSSQSGIVLNEFLVEISEPEEGLDLFHRFRGRPVQDRGDLGWIHSDAGGGHHVADESHFSPY